MKIPFEYEDSVAVIKLSHSTTNELSPEVVFALSELLQQLDEDPNVSSIVLTSTNRKFFSIGFDLPRLLTLPRKDFEYFYKRFNQMCLDLYTLKKPTTAAILGHAVAGGCILSLCCDYRYISSGKKLMGLNEVLLGVPIPYPAHCILKGIVSAKTARDVAEQGRFYLADALLAMEVVDKVLPVDEVLPQAVKNAKELGSSLNQAFARIKYNHIEATCKQIFARQEEEQEYFFECWYSPKAQRLLSEAAKKF